MAAGSRSSVLSFEKRFSDRRRWNLSEIACRNGKVVVGLNQEKVKTNLQGVSKKGRS